MSVRVVARVRPLLTTENDKDVIVQACDGSDGRTTIVKLPNPKNFSENYTFDFNSVYGELSTQQELFEAEGRRLGLKYENSTEHVSSCANDQAPFPGV